MTAPVRPRSSLPASNLTPTPVLGGVLEGHHIGDPPFYFNGQLGVLQPAPTSGDALFVPLVEGPPVPPSQIFVPPDINTAWNSLMWAMGSGIAYGLNDAKDVARAIRRIR